jgi:hypothetical protein
MRPIHLLPFLSLVGCGGSIDIDETNTSTTGTATNTTATGTNTTTTGTNTTTTGTNTTTTSTNTTTTGTTTTTTPPAYLCGDDTTAHIEITETDANAISISNLDTNVSSFVSSVATVSWTQSSAWRVHVEYTFENNEWHSTPSFTAKSGSNEQIVVGVPFNYDVAWRVVIEDGGSVTEGPDYRTGNLDNDVPRPDVLVSRPSEWLPEGNFLLSTINEQTGGWTSGDYWTFILDRKGRYVWAHKAPDRNWSLFAQTSLDGCNVLWDESTLWSQWDDGASSSIHRTYLDEEVEQYNTPGLHHAWVQIDDDNIAWGSQDHGGKEALVESEWDSNSEHIIWTCQEDWQNSGNCESNGLFYQESTESFLYSFYTNNSMVEVDRFNGTGNSGTSLWWAGEVGNGYNFVPADSQYSWQHGVSYTDAGTLLVSTEARISGSWTTMVREYDVNHGATQLEEVWNYDAEVYASTNGDAWRLSNGNTLHMVGSAGEGLEVDEDGDTVWHIDFGGTHLLGRGELLESLYPLVKPH